MKQENKTTKQASQTSQAALEIITNFANKKKQIEKRTGRYCKAYNKIISNIFLKNF